MDKEKKERERDTRQLNCDLLLLLVVVSCQDKKEENHILSVAGWLAGEVAGNILTIPQDTMIRLGARSPLGRRKNKMALIEKQKEILLNL